MLVLKIFYLLFFIIALQAPLSNSIQVFSAAILCAVSKKEVSTPFRMFSLLINVEASVETMPAFKSSSDWAPVIKKKEAIESIWIANYKADHVSLHHLENLGPDAKPSSTKFNKSDTGLVERYLKDIIDNKYPLEPAESKNHLGYLPGKGIFENSRLDSLEQNIRDLILKSIDRDKDGRCHGVLIQ